MNQVATRERITEDGVIETIEGTPGASLGQLATVDQSLAVGLSRAEIDQQIATARQYPRSIQRALQTMETLATLNDAAAESCMYSVPRAGKAIEGASIRFAEILVSSWGNCRVAGRVVYVDRVEKFVEAEGIFWDLETNAGTRQTRRERIFDKRGNIYNDDMITMIGNAAVSKAKRNAILAGVPKPVWLSAYEKARAVIMGSIETLATRRSVLFQQFQRFGITADQLYALVGARGEADIGLEQCLALRGMHSALKSGEETVETLLGALAGTTKPDARRPQKTDFKEQPKGDDTKSGGASAVSGDGNGGHDGGAGAADGGPGAEAITDDDGGSELGPADAMDLGRADFRARRPRRAPTEWQSLPAGERDALTEAYEQGYDDEESEAKIAKATAPADKARPRK